jgi:hypothetical protein
MQPPSGGLLPKQNIAGIHFWDMGEVLQRPRPNCPYMPEGFSGIKRDQAGSSGITREPKWGYPHSGSTLLARIPRALPAPRAPLPEFWGPPRIPASTKTTAGNSGKQRRRVLRISGLGRCFRNAPPRADGIPGGCYHNRREPSRAIATVANRRELSQPSRATATVANRRELSQPSRTVASYRNE